MTTVRERTDKAKRTSDIAFGIIDAEASAREAKTAKLKKLREERAAASAPEDAGEKPAPKKRAFTRKPRQVGP